MNDLDQKIEGERLSFDAPVIVDYGNVAKETLAGGGSTFDGNGGYS